MRKITLLITLFLSIASNIFAQEERSCDLSIRVVEPLDGAVMPYGDTAFVRVSIRNNGPDTVWPTDTIYYKIEGAAFNFRVSDSTIAAGDSMVLLSISTWASVDQTSDERVDFCFHFGNHLAGFTDENSSNDTSCVSFTLKGNVPSSLSESSVLSGVKVYPNPVTNKLLHIDMIGLSNKEASFVIADVYGRIQKQGQRAANGSDLVKLDLSGFATGVYFLKIATADGSVTSTIYIE
jgi:hypothetical protein